MAGGGGQSGGIEGYLPIAAALAATVMTDGAAAPLLEESLGTTGAAAVMGGGIGALAGGATAALTGQDVGRNALMGGLGGATLGYGGLYSGAPEAGMSFAGAPLAGSNVAGTIASPAATTAMNELATAPTAAGGLSPYAQALGSSLSTTPESGIAYFDAIGQSGAAPVLSTASDTALANATGAGAQTAANTAASTGLGATLSKAAPYALGATALGTLMTADNKKYGTPSPASQKYTGPLTKFKYDPNQYTPTIAAQPNPAYQPQYSNVGGPFSAAEGGTVPSYAVGGLLDPNSEPVDFMGGDMYPQSQIERSYYATPTQAPTSAQQAMASYEPKTNPLTGEPTAHMAAGGIAGTSLGGYASGGNPRLLKGPGDGISDSIPAVIGNKQPARLADGEFVLPARIVSEIGNGSTDAGAKKLYAMMDRVQKARKKSMGKGKFAKDTKASKELDKL